MPDVHIEGGGKLQFVTHSFTKMEDTQRLKLHYVAAMPYKEVFQQQLNILLSMRGRVRWRRGARARSIWVRPWHETTAVRNL